MRGPVALCSGPFSFLPLRCVGEAGQPDGVTTALWVFDEMLYHLKAVCLEKLTIFCFVEATMIKRLSLKLSYRFT
jgi:hypothetical protein